MARSVGGGRSSSGHRSSGGRATSHHRSGGSRGGSSFSGGNRRPSGGYGGHRPHHRPPHHGPSYHRPPRYGTSYHRPYRSYYGRSYRRGTGCGSAAALILVILVIVFVAVSEVLSAGLTFIMSFFGSMAPAQMINTRQREKLDRNLVNVSQEWYTDEIGWIDYESELISGMKTFYSKTGIQPYLYLVDSKGTMDESEMVLFANEAYDKLFTDEGHILLCYFSCKNDSEEIIEGDLQLIMGKNTEQIMDSDAIDVFWDTYDYYYEDSRLDTEALFGRTFSETGNKIMTAPFAWKKLAIVAVIVVGVIILIVVLARWWNTRMKHTNNEQNKLEKMLNSSKQSYGDSSSDN